MSKRNKQLTVPELVDLLDNDVCACLDEPNDLEFILRITEFAKELEDSVRDYCYKNRKHDLYRIKENLRVLNELKAKADPAKHTPMDFDEETVESQMTDFRVEMQCLTEFEDFDGYLVKLMLEEMDALVAQVRETCYQNRKKDLETLKESRLILERLKNAS